MREIRHPRWLYIKAALLLCAGALASAVLLNDARSWRAAALLAIAIWAFCRAYYFAFYVIEHYVDSSFRFAGVLDFVHYIWRRRSAGPRDDETLEG